MRPSRLRTTIAIGAVVALGVGGGGVAGLTIAYRNTCTSPCVDLTRITGDSVAQASVVYDRRGHELARFFVENRRLVRLSDVPLTLRYAVLASEDARFYQHHGIDWMRVGGALWHNLHVGRTAQGSSTITMQLARIAYPELLSVTNKTFHRKLLEMRIAREIEAGLSKDDILEAYLNTVPLGRGAYGVEAASTLYFGMSVRDLGLNEAAILAGLPKAPSRDNPITNPQRAAARRGVVLGRMVAEGLIGDTTRRRIMTLPVLGAHHDSLVAAPVLRAVPTDTLAPAFVEVVRQMLAETFGARLYRAGFAIHTTLDPIVQRTADSLFQRHLAHLDSVITASPPRRSASAFAGEPLEGALLVMAADSGDVLALIGGRDFRQSKFNRATQALRQPGSAFKPIVYAAALEHGFTGASILDNTPVSVPQPDGSTWSPANFDAGKDAGDVTLATALAHSQNRATVRLALAVGTDSIVSMARRLGLTTPLPRVSALSLGAGTVRMLELVGAYTPAAREDGSLVLPRWVRRVADRDGKTVLANPPQSIIALAPGTAARWRELMAGVVQRGTGITVRTLGGYTGPAAGKTGTTNDATDVWFVGITPRLAAGVWFGYDHPAPIGSGAVATGGAMAAPLWGRLMAALPDSIRGAAWPTAAAPDPVPDTAPVSTSSRADTAPHADTGALCLERLPRSGQESEQDPPPARFVPCHTLRGRRGQDSAASPPASSPAPVAPTASGGRSTGIISTSTASTTTSSSAGVVGTPGTRGTSLAP